MACRKPFCPRHASLRIPAVFNVSIFFFCVPSEPFYRTPAQQLECANFHLQTMKSVKAPAAGCAVAVPISLCDGNWADPSDGFSGSRGHCWDGAMSSSITSTQSGSVSYAGEESDRTTSVQQLLEAQHEIHARMQAFSSESVAKRDRIVRTFASIRAVLDGVERAALVEFDSEVKSVLKQLEVEANGTEVLSQQVAAGLLASCGLNTSSECVFGEQKDRLASVKCVDVVINQQGLSSLLVDCWRLVSVESDADDQQPFQLAEAEAELVICDQVRQSLLVLTVYARLN